MLRNFWGSPVISMMLPYLFMPIKRNFSISVKFYGSEVLSCNSAVQGCSFSVLMIHSMYAILARSIDRTFPDISIATFVDDAKIWTKANLADQLVEAFSLY